MAHVSYMSRSRCWYNLRSSPVATSWRKRPVCARSRRKKARLRPSGEGAGVPQAAQDSVAPEFGEFLPAARWGEVKVTVGREDTGGGQHVYVRVPKEEVAKVEEGGDGCDGFGREAGHLGGVIVENLPEGRGARLAGTVAGADHPAERIPARSPGPARERPKSGLIRRSAALVWRLHVWNTRAPAGRFGG